MKTKVLSLILFSLLLLNSPSNSQDTISAKYFPLNVGNKWVYRVQSNFPPFNDKVFKIERDTIINSHKYFLYKSIYNSEWIRYDTLSGNLLVYSPSNGCSNNSNDKIKDSLSSGIGDIIYCEYFATFIRECTQISTELFFNTFQRQTKQFEHDGLVLEYVKYAQDFGITYSASGEPPPVSSYNILKGCIINGIVYGDTTLTGIVQTSSVIPEKFSLEQNYPNPFNPKTIINYSISSNVKGQMSKVKLVVYNNLGKEVVTLVNENQNAGSYRVEFDGSSLASGIYFYKLEAGDFVETKRMILLR